MIDRTRARLACRKRGTNEMLYAHKCADSEEDLLTNLAGLTATALPFPAKSATSDEEDKEWQGYDVANTRIDMLLRGWGHPLD